jgi:predicted RNA methylase
MKTHSISNEEFLERELKANIGFHGDQYIGLMRNTYNTLRAITGEIDVFVDLGAGTGVLSAVASEDAGRVRAFDTNPEHKKYFKANAPAKFPSAERVNYCDCDFTKKKFRFGGGNIVLACIEVAEHIPQPEYERFLENVEDRADWLSVQLDAEFAPRIRRRMGSHQYRIRRANGSRYTSVSDGNFTSG